MFYIEQAGVSAANSVAQLQVAGGGRFGAAAIWSGAPSGGVGSGITVILRLPNGAVVFSFTNNGTVAAVVNFKAVALNERLGPGRVRLAAAIAAGVARAGHGYQPGARGSLLDSDEERDAAQP